MNRRHLRHIHAWLLAIAFFSGCSGNDPARLWSQAQDEWKAGRLEDAEATLARLARVRPLMTSERLLRAQVARDRGRLDEAAEALGEIPEGTPPAEAAVLASTRGTIELQRNRFRQALVLLEKAVALDPKRDEARRELIALHAVQGRLGDMDAQFRALARSPESALTFADLYLWTVGRREDQGNAEAAEALSRALRADPEDHASRKALGENLRRLGRLDEAEAALASLSESDAEAQALRARIALDRGDAPRAEAILTAIPSPSPAVDRLRGRLALARGDAPAAVAAFRAAFATEPNDRDTRFGLAQALRLAGDADGARPHADFARELDRLDWMVQNARPEPRRGDPATLRVLGDACLALGLREPARGWYRLALSRNPLDSGLQRTLHELDAPVENRGPG